MTIAFWCVLIMILLPYVWFGILASKLGGRRDNNLPRAVLVGLEGTEARLLGAHLNSFEATIGFVAGVVIAQLAHAPQGRIDVLAIIFVLARVAHGILYMAGLGTLRSAAFFLGLACTIGLFVVSV
jgi:uncharacterized MAPEG superfamily protein